MLKKEIRKEEVYTIIDKGIYWNFLQKRIGLVLIISLILIGFFFQTYPHFYTWDTDAPSFYTAAKGILKHINIYDPQEFQQLADSLFGRSNVVFPYLYWPILAQVFTPFTLLSYSDYSQVLLIINIILTFFCVYLIYAVLDLDKRKTNLPLIFLFLIVFFNSPLQETLHHGQVNILVFATILLSLLLLKRRKEFLSALLLCLAIFFKIYPVLFVILFFFQKRYRYLIYTAINFVYITILSVLLFSFNSWLYFIKMALNNFLYGKKTEFFFDFSAQWNNFSLNGLISQLLMRFNLPRSYVMLVLTLVVIFSFFIFLPRLKKLIKSSDIGLVASVVLTIIIILSTISWRHHYFIMMFPIAYFFNKIITERRYTYLIPFLLLTYPILYAPFGGGFPFNQIMLISTMLFLWLLLHYHFSGISGKEGEMERYEEERAKKLRILQHYESKEIV